MIIYYHTNFTISLFSVALNLVRGSGLFYAGSKFGFSRQDFGSQDVLIFTDVIFTIYLFSKVLGLGLVRFWEMFGKFEVHNFQVQMRAST